MTKIKLITLIALTVVVGAGGFYTLVKTNVQVTLKSPPVESTVPEESSTGDFRDKISGWPDMTNLQRFEAIKAKWSEFTPEEQRQASEEKNRMAWGKEESKTYEPVVPQGLEE